MCKLILFYYSSAFIQEDMSEEFVYMDQRQKDLEEICKVSSQIKNITDTMVVETKKQGQDIGKLLKKLNYKI